MSIPVPKVEENKNKNTNPQNYSIEKDEDNDSIPTMKSELRNFISGFDNTNPPKPDNKERTTSTNSVEKKKDTSQGGFGMFSKLYGKSYKLILTFYSIFPLDSFNYMTGSSNKDQPLISGIDLNATSD